MGRRICFLRNCSKGSLRLMLGSSHPLWVVWDSVQGLQHRSFGESDGVSVVKSFFNLIS